MKPTVTDDKPAVDRASLQDFLAAAYVVQKHNDRLQAGHPPENGHSQILKDILELQEQLQSPHFDLREKMAAVARRVREMAQASGSAVGLLLGDDLEYYAATGSAAKQAGARVPQDSSLARECLRTGQILQCSAAETDPRLDQALCRSLGVKALIAVPVKHEGKLVGVVEVHFSEFNSFHDQEVRTCELVSSLVADAIFASAAEEPVQELPAPPSAVAPNIALPVNPHNTDALLAALDKIRPRLEQLARKSLDSSHTPPESASKELLHEPEAAAAQACRNCGHGLAEDEDFCGVCGSARQPKNIWSSLLDMQRKAEHSAQQNGRVESGDPFDDSLGVFPSELEEIIAKFSGELSEPKSSEVALPDFAQELVSPGHSSKNEERAPEQALQPEEIEEDSSVLKQEQLAVPAPDVDEVAAEPTRPFLVERSSEGERTADEPYPPFVGFASENNLLSLPTEPEVSSFSAETEAAQDLPVPVAGDEASPTLAHPLNSAVKAKEWLEAGRSQESRLVKFWQEQRANVYLVAAALLLVTVLLGWASPSPPPNVVGKVGNAGKAPATDVPPEPELTLSEKVLVSLGLAEAPRVETAEPGNPNTQVWIDVHTALYYCPGADLYGKTPGGRTAPQHQAQLDQFQPALRKACN